VVVVSMLAVVVSGATVVSGGEVGGGEVVVGIESGVVRVGGTRYVVAWIPVVWKAVLVVCACAVVVVIVVVLFVFLPGQTAIGRASL
jgi:hypothetical protein